MFFQKRQPRPILGLNVVPLIDVSALIIIFLIMGAVFGDTSITVPAGLEVPKSLSKETAEHAASVVIGKTDVQASFLPDAAALSLFNGPANDRRTEYVAKLKDFVQKLPPEMRKGGVLLNVIADKGTPYKDIFDVVGVFREAGFQSLLFVARGK